MNEIKKIVHGMKKEINKDMETLKNYQSGINNSISQIKSSIKNLANTVEQVENRVSGMEDKAEKLYQTIINRERMLRKYEWNIQDIWDIMKRPKL
jgi:predicted  nucleic acid-binding Zn-ribbon protein